MKKTLPLLIAILAVAGPLAGASIQRELQAAPGEMLVVNVRGGSIQVEGWNRNAVSVNLTADGRDADELDVQIRRTAKGVEIVQPRRRAISRGSLEIRVSVPSRFNLEVDTMGGSIGVRGVAGNLSGRTMGGALRLERVGGVLAMSTHGGNVVLRDSAVDGSVTTMGGEVLFENVVGDVKGTSMGGNVVYRNVTRRDGSSSGKAVHITTMGGDIAVSDAPDGAELSTMGGGIGVRSARGFVKAKTMGGSIDIDAVDGWVEATTMGGDVSVTMVGNPAQGDRHVMIDSRSGEIELTVPAGLEMEIDIQIAFTKNSSRDYGIVSDFPLQITRSPEWEYGEGSARRIVRGRGTTGGAKHKIVIRTINGGVRLKRG